MKKCLVCLLLFVMLCGLFSGCLQPEAAQVPEPELQQSINARESEWESREQDLSRRETELQSREQEASQREEMLRQDESSLAESGQQSAADSASFGASLNPSTERTNLNPGVEATAEEREAARIEWLFDRWVENLDPDMTGGVYMDDDQIHLWVNVLDIAAFEKSAAMAEAQENGYSIKLKQVKYSWNQLTDAQKKLDQYWDKYKLSWTGQDTMNNCLTVGLVADTEKNRQEIRDLCGVDNIVFEKADSQVNPTT